MSFQNFEQKNTVDIKTVNRTSFCRKKKRVHGFLQKLRIRENPRFISLNGEIKSGNGYNKVLVNINKLQ